MTHTLSSNTISQRMNNAVVIQSMHDLINGRISQAELPAVIETRQSAAAQNGYRAYGVAQ